MDVHLEAAARALSAFDPVEALRYVAHREDARAVMLRGVALAQLGEFKAALKLLVRAGRALSKTDAAASARCLAAEAEVALAARDLASAGRGFDAAALALEALGDEENAQFVRLQQARRHVLLGDLQAAEDTLATFEGRPVAARTAAVHELVAAELAVRRLDPRAARDALSRANRAARSARLPPLLAEVKRALSALDAPVARVTSGGGARDVTLEGVVTANSSGALLVDGVRRLVRDGERTVALASRPVLFELVSALGEAAPGDVPRETLIARIFGGRSDESHRARLRVEAGRLRRLLDGIADIRATSRGYALVARHGARVMVLSPPVAGDAGALLGLLSDGEPWSTSALATSIGASQRAVQRVLGELARSGEVHAVGRGRAVRWVASPRSRFATTLLLAARLPRD